LISSISRKLNFVYNGTIIENIKIFGVQWNRLNTWNFMSPIDQDISYLGGWNKIPEDTDIVLTHQSPHGILDDDIHHWGSFHTLQQLDVLDQNIIYLVIFIKRMVKQI
jgi:hypothetical protein